MTAVQKRVREQVATVGKWMSDARTLQQIRHALPHTGLTAERLTRIVLTEVRKNPKLAECRIQSLMGAMMLCAQYGLEPGPQGFAWLIPRKNKGVLEVNFQLGYKGLCQLLWRSDGISWINAQCVHQNDSFDYSLGAPPRIDFKPSEDEDRGIVTHVFAAIGTKSGGILPEVWPTAKVEAHRQRFSRAGEGSPWDTDWEMMAKKTLLIQAAKFAPLSLETAQAIAIDERGEHGMAQEIDVTPPKTSDEPPMEVDPETGEVIPDGVGREPEQGTLT